MSLLNAVVLVVVWGVSLISTILHGTLLPWWRSELGVYYFAWPTMLTIVLTPNMVRLIFGDFPARQAVNSVMFVLLAILVVYGLVLLVKYLWTTRRKEV